MERTIAGLEGWPLNIGLQAGARAIEDGDLDALVDAGAVGFKIHEDNGAYPELIDHVLRYVDARDLTSACTPTGCRVGRARGHGRGHRRPDGPRLPRGGDGRRPRA